MHTTLCHFLRTFLQPFAQFVGVFACSFCTKCPKKLRRFVAIVVRCSWQFVALFRGTSTYHGGKSAISKAKTNAIYFANIAIMIDFASNVV